MSEIVDTGFDLPGAVYAPEVEHASDCAVHNAPALPVGPCDCGPEFTAAVNPGPSPVEPVPSTAAVGLTKEGRDAAKALLPPMPKDFGHTQMVAIARELAMDLLTVDVIIKKHGLTHAQFEFISDNNEFFKHVLQQQATEWQGISSTQDRLRAQAAAALEEQLPVIASRMGSRSEKLVETVEAAKLLAKVAGVDGQPAGGHAPGERFVINIDLGADARLVIGAETSSSQGQVSPALHEVRAIPQGEN